MASSAMVSRTPEDGCSSAIPTTKFSIDNDRQESRTTQKFEMESLCMEGQWQSLLKDKGWSDRAIQQFVNAWAPSTRKLYNGVFKKLHDFCLAKESEYPPTKSATVADFLCFLSDSSDKPNSILRSAMATLSWLYKLIGHPEVIQEEHRLLVTALVKSGTVKGMENQVLPNTNKTVPQMLL